MVKIKAIVFDLDGTIYCGNKLLENTLDVIKQLKEYNIKIFFMSNNSTSNVKSISNKLNNMGFNYEWEAIYSSGSAAIRYLNEKAIKEVYLVGMDNFKEEICNQGISIIDNEYKAKNMLIGLTNFNYDILTRAVRAAINSDNIIACNKDRNYIGNEGLLYPGCGSIVVPIEWCSGKKITKSIGKPDTTMLEMLCKDNKLSREEIVVVGDSYETDICAANNFSCKSILIGSNVNAKYCVNNIAGIMPILYPESDS